VRCRQDGARRRGQGAKEAGWCRDGRGVRGALIIRSTVCVTVTDDKQVTRKGARLHRVSTGESTQQYLEREGVSHHHGDSRSQAASRFAQFEHETAPRRLSLAPSARQLNLRISECRVFRSACDGKATSARAPSRGQVCEVTQRTPKSNNNRSGLAGFLKWIPGGLCWKSHRQRGPMTPPAVPHNPHTANAAPPAAGSSLIR
jgi:hypothetical protein